MDNSKLNIACNKCKKNANSAYFDGDLLVCIDCTNQDGYNRGYVDALLNVKEYIDNVLIEKSYSY